MLPPRERPQKVLPLVDSDVMVDFTSYFRHGPGFSKIGELPIMDDLHDCQCPICSENEATKTLFKPHYDGCSGSSTESWEDVQLMLCPPRVLGYVLKEKRWAQLAVTNLDFVKDEPTDGIMKDLYLAGKDDGRAKKDFLMGLVRHHGELELKDLVPGKGEGLVFLLYGEPGVGKTSTGVYCLLQEADRLIKLTWQHKWWLGRRVSHSSR
jgi:hypothetical protein